MLMLIYRDISNRLEVCLALEDNVCLRMQFEYTDIIG